MSYKLKINDTVIVITGKDKGKIGKVKKIFHINNKIIVLGINKVKKHEKNKIILKESPLDISNVAIFNPYTQKADKILLKYDKKNRFYKSNNLLIK